MCLSNSPGQSDVWFVFRYIGDGPVDLISTPDSSLHFTSEPEENDEDDVISDIETNLLGNSSIGW